MTATTTTWPDVAFSAVFLLFLLGVFYIMSRD